MQRRKFIDLLLSTFGSIISLPIMLPASTRLLPQTRGLMVESYRGGQSILKEITFKRIDGSVYFSMADFVNAIGLGIYTNEARQKSVLYIGSDKATFTAGNPFVVLNDRTYQLTHLPRWEHNELLITPQALIALFNNFTSHSFSFDEKEMILTLGMKNVNITGVKVDTMDNGTLIRVNSNKKFRKQDVSLKVANGWLHIDVFGGKADKSAIEAVQTAGIVSDIQVIEFDQLISLAFRLRTSILSRDLVFDPSSNDFYVNLRTDDKIDHDREDVQEELAEQKKEWLIDTIVIDPGHGGKDPGAVGYGGLKEKEIVLSVGLLLEKIMAKQMPEVKVVFTRRTDKFIPLWQRTKIANEQKGKLFISLHCNSNKSRSAKGFETYFLSADKDKNQQAQEVVLKENASIRFEDEQDQKRYEGINFILATMAQSAFIRQSQYLASTVQNSFARTLKPLGMKDRGVKQGRFWVMVGATMPNILVEMGFISNKIEANLLKKTSTQQKVAQAVFEGIKKYKADIEAAI